MKSRGLLGLLLVSAVICSCFGAVLAERDVAQELLQSWASFLVAQIKQENNHEAMPVPSSFLQLEEEIDAEEEDAEEAPFDGALLEAKVSVDAAAEEGAELDAEAEEGEELDAEAETEEGDEEGAEEGEGGGATPPTYTYPRSLDDINANIESSVAENKLASGGLSASGVAIPDMRWGTPTLGPVMGRGVGQYAFLRGIIPAGDEPFFKQNKECDMAMRLWLTQCAFAEDKEHVFWADNAQFAAAAVDGDTEEGKEGEAAMKSSVETASTASYIGNLLANAAAEASLGEYSYANQKARDEHTKPEAE